jgi:N-acetylmuramoyl-L-alanine amidase
MPSVLVEVGFLTNYEEAVLLTDKNYLSKLGLGIYNGLVDFINHFETGRGY